jgi:uncharacterized protein YcbK (DUF882 family)
MPTRRDVLARTGAALAAPVLCSPALLLARPARAVSGPGGVLAFEHTHTGETLRVGLRTDGTPVPTEMRAVDRFLRDFRSGEVSPIDPALLQQLHRLVVVTGTRAPFQVISGFRSEHTNAMLRRRGGGGVARSSLHLEGRAIDVRLPDVALADLRVAAQDLKAGGVGFYPDAGFVHLDTGRMRSW